MAAHQRTVVVAINPMASFGHRREVGPLVVQRLRDAGHVAIAVDEANIELLRRETSRAVEAGADALVVVGGDGMANLGINIVAQTAVPLGIVPSGTGNDLADGLGIPVGDTEGAIAHLLAALDREPRTIDAGVVRHGDLSTWFGGVLSAGFDATVNERANLMTRPRGRSRYILALLRELATLAPRPYRIVVDGEVLETEAMLVSVANNRSLGGGMRIVPHASLDDGRLDLFIVRRMSKARFLRMFPKVFRGEHTDLPEVAFRPLTSARIEAEGVVAYADGERIGPLPVDVGIVPGALRVLV
ncbi:YegS/Rv2252/BmrU family lipid kinase [Leifsonia aquatica]|uniref:Diacylglycerol kinase (ATP) n=2 Tax=Leifsonia aquatica TaxID=144185 RepID=A0A7W4UU49_LEIAQ|nr:YegS/Rv2252/BmrU family lipid kinase [Leifsonia aquatica]ERK71000.1 putative diacylglycerol kinase [Leifsonia aquatica ATCC 14665]MBB2966092.1 diacylglycerol kinase (ATP) [Leifsonia aquatica]